MPLRHKVELYVPNNGSLVEEEVVSETHRMFIIQFGGATINPVLGGWFDGGLLVMDKINIVYAYAEKITPKIKKMLVDQAVYVRGKLKQETVMLVIDDVADFY